MRQELTRLFRYRALQYVLARRDVSIRYKQSVMGFLWAILMPMLIVGAGALVRVAAGKFSGGHVSNADIQSVIVRAVVWSFVIAAVRFSTASLIGNTNLVTKIAFPKEVFPIAAVLSSLFDFAIAAVAALVAMALLGWVPGLMALWALPMLVVTVMLVLGSALVLSATNLFFRDVKYIVEIFLTYAIFFTPVLYSADAVGKWKNIIMLNPIAPLLEGISDTLVEGVPPDYGWLGYSAGFAFVALFAGYWLFKQLESTFAERI